MDNFLFCADDSFRRKNNVCKVMKLRLTLLMKSENARLLNWSFVTAVGAPILFALCSIVYHNTPLSGKAMNLLGAHFGGILLTMLMLSIPGALLYVAAILSRRNWFCVVCIVVAWSFCGVYIIFLSPKGDGLAIPAIAALELIVALIAMLVAGAIRLIFQANQPS